MSKLGDLFPHMLNHRKQMDEDLKERKRTFQIFKWIFVVMMSLGLVAFGWYGFLSYKCYKGNKQACVAASNMVLANSFDDDD